MGQGKLARKYSQAGRLHSIIRLMETRRGMTLDDLAVECAVDRRTIQRDQAEVLEPPGLRALVERQVDAMVRLYRGDGVSP